MIESLAHVQNTSPHPTLPASRVADHSLSGMGGGFNEEVLDKNAAEIPLKYRPLVIQSAPAVSFGPDEHAQSTSSRQCSTLLADITNVLAKAPLERLPLTVSSRIPHPAFKSIMDYGSDEED